MKIQKHKILNWKVATVFFAVVFSFALFAVNSGLEAKVFHTVAYADDGVSGGGCSGCGGSTGGASGGNPNGNGGNGGTPKTCDIWVTVPAIGNGGGSDQYIPCPKPPKDFCPNISGTQESVPSGYVTDSSGNCVIDQCPNISGIQTSVPVGQVKDGSGNCVIDQCPNISGIQTSIPSGYVLNNGQCVIDKCPNLSGVQTSIPNGYVVNGAGQCVIDQCPNIDGIQESIPSGYTKDSAGMCQPPKDYCPNIAGVQTSVPAGKIVDASGNCVDIPQCVAPKLTSATSAEGQVGVVFTYALTVSGTQPITVKFDNLPAGLTASGNTISGTPTKAGTYEVGVTIDNKCGNVCTKIVITVKAGECIPGKPVLPSQQTTSGTVGQAFSYEVQVTNQPTEITATNLPAGLTINTNTGIISGTPTAAGNFTVHIKAKNACGEALIDITIKITTNVCVPGTPTITSSLAASGVVGTPFSYTITTDKTATEYSATGLPAGLTFSTSTGIISGTPTAPGTFEVSLKAKNTCGDDYKKLVITITGASCPVPVPHITSGTSASATLNQAFSYTLTTSGNPTTVAAGTLPAWLSFDPVTGILSGTPTSAGTYTVDFSIQNQCGTDHMTLTIVVTGGGGSCVLTAPTITSGTDLSVTVHQQVSYTVTTTGTVTSLSVENLPTWLYYSTSSQVIFGTAPSSGDYSVTIKAANECALSQITLNIHVIGEPGCTSNCGGGGFFAPTIVLLQHATTTNPLASYASVYLSQVPYTGAGDIATTLAFLLGLLVLSLGVAYVIVYRRELTYKIFGNKRMEQSYSIVAAPSGVFEAPLIGVRGLPDHPRHPTSEAPSSNGTVYEEVMTKKNEEKAEEDMSSVKTFYSSDFGASISEGLAAIKQNLERKDTVMGAPKGEVPSPADNVMEATLQETARASNAMLSKDGVELILTAADHKIENADRILNQMISVASEWYPAGEGAYLLLDAARVRSILFSTYVSMVPLFIRWIAENDHAKVFNFLRMINQQGHAVSDFVKAVAYELDKVYRFRTEHDSGADEYSVQVTANWKKETIEKVVTTLVGGFDDNYSSSLTAAKLAFSKVLDTVRTQNIPAAEMYRLAEGN